MQWKSSSVLLTGGAGFIGSHLTRRLVSEGAVVRVADNFSRGSIANIQDLLGSIELLNVDLTDPHACAAACKGVDYVFHLAASVGGIQYIKKENVEGCTPSLLMNTNILEAARRNDIQRLLFASSACVYHEKSLALNSFVEEDAYPAWPATTYGWTKLMGEIQCQSYAVDYGLKNCAVRIFNAYGENENLDPKTAHVIPSLIRKAINYPRERFTVFGDGKQERAFLYVKDCVEGLIRCIERIDDGSPINLGSAETVSIANLANNIVSLSEKRIDIEFDPSGPQGTHRYCANISKMEKALKWRPQTSLATGLKRTFAWARGILVDA